MTQTNLPQAITVNIPATLKLTVTHEQLVELAIANRDLQLERTATGELIVMAPTGSDTGNRNLDIEGQKDSSGCGTVRLNEARHLIPQLAFTFLMELIALLMLLGCVKKGGMNLL